MTNNESYFLNLPFGPAMMLLIFSFLSGLKKLHHVANNIERKKKLIGTWHGLLNQGTVL